MISEFLQRFQFILDTSSRELIDLKLALKALPYKVNDHNVYRIEMINFGLAQKSLIAFQNDDQDELFNYYDNRQKTRLRKMQRKAVDTQTGTNDIKMVGSSVLSILNKIFNLGSYIKRQPQSYTRLHPTNSSF